MSQENVEVIKEALAAWNRGDMDAVMSAMSHDVILDPLAIFDPLAGGSEGGEITGLEAVMERFRAVRDGFERDWVEIRQIRDFGEAQVLVECEWCGIPLGGHGDALRLHAFDLFTLRNGRVIHFAYCPDLEAAGLSE
jgi:ketosteroid isomerase-like protein